MTLDRKILWFLRAYELRFLKVNPNVLFPIKNLQLKKSNLTTIVSEIGRENILGYAYVSDCKKKLCTIF